MESIIQWITNNGGQVLEVAIYFVIGATAIVGFFNGPRADRAKGILGTILGLLRRFSVSTYKDEPGTWSIPGKGDSGKRVADNE